MCLRWIGKGCGNISWAPPDDFIGYLHPAGLTKSGNDIQDTIALAGSQVISDHPWISFEYL
jgi:hypothetical protein